MRRPQRWCLYRLDMAAIICPACGLKNPSSAVMCDCGHVLNQNVDAMTLAGAVRANHEVRSRRNVAVPAGIGAVIVLLILLRVVLRVL